jgi:hypothetical protein
MTWEESWEQNKYEVGRAMHLGWKRQKIENGFADHPLDAYCFSSPDKACGMDKPCHTCDLPPDRHHPDMVDWDLLPESQKAINYAGGREGFRMGFLVGRMSQ